MPHSDKRQITLFMTTACNLNCDYCITTIRNQHKKSASIDVDFACIGINDFFRKHESHWIRFYGPGEPTLELDKMEAIRQFAQSESKGSLKTELQTNGFFDTSIVEWVARNIDILYVSYDDPDPNGPSARKTISGGYTGQTVLRNITDLLADCDLSVRATITTLNIYKQKELVKLLADIGVDKVFSKPVLRKIGEDSEPAGLAVNLDEYTRTFIDAYHYACDLGVFYGNIYMANFDGVTSWACRACLPCPHLTPDGYVTACDRAFSCTTPLSAFIYGQYNKDDCSIEYWPDKIDNLRNRVPSNMVSCSSCEIRNFCAGHCLATCYQYTGSIYVPDARHCAVVKELYRKIGSSTQKFPYHP